MGAEAAPRGPLGLRVLHDDIGWYDTAYYDAGGGENPMGGIVGALGLEVEDGAALPALVLGQYLGLGQRRTFGWGRYRLECADGKGTQPPRRPSRTLLSRAADPANLELAYRAIRANQQLNRIGGNRKRRRYHLNAVAGDRVPYCYSLHTHISARAYATHVERGVR